MKNTILLVGVLLTMVSTQSLAKVLKVSTLYPDGTAVVKSLKAAAKDIETATEGRVKIKFYPGGVQGDNKTVLKKIKRGILAGALIETGALASEYKDSQIYNVPMLFNNFDEVNYVRERMDQQLIDGFDNVGWKMFGFIDGGFAYAMTNNPATNIDALKSQKLWLPANDALSEKVATALGLSPIYLGIGEVLTALQTGAINAIAAPPSAALTLQWYSKLKYVTDVPFMYTLATLAISDKAFKKISVEDQVVVAEKLREAIKDLDDSARKDNLKAFAALSSQGLTIKKPTADESLSLKSQADVATTVLLKQGEFSQASLDTITKLLTEARSQ